jgi:DNA-binding Lrp family transcriptional regulator
VDVRALNEKKKAKLKDVEIRIIAELMKNSRRSDRELAKVLGVSQPTITRTRTSLESQGLIEYTAVPDFARLGYELLVFTLVKRHLEKFPYSRERANAFFEKTLFSYLLLVA